LDLGFEVVRVGQDWTNREVDATIAAYFDMLRLESLGIAYNKSERNEQLRTELTTRSKASIELKFQNISAVLDQLALPYVRGYKPRANLQALLRQAVLQYVDSHREALTNVMEDFDERTTPGEQRFRGVLVEPPKIEALPNAAARVRLPRKLDYAAREERNRNLGRGGEAWTLDFEKTRLFDAARPDLASKIDWISDRLGDGTGYDILSFETTELARFVEVKTTSGASATPFIVTRNELEFSEETEDAFCLYRVFDFAVAPKLFILRGPLGGNLDLEPLDFRARLKATT
jgi:hypothetical protein